MLSNKPFTAVKCAILRIRQFSLIYASSDMDSNMPRYIDDMFLFHFGAYNQSFTQAVMCFYMRRFLVTILWLFERLERSPQA